MRNAWSLGSRTALGWSDQSDYPLDWNGPVERPFEAFPDEAKASPIIELLRAVVRRHPRRIALAGSEFSITYEQLLCALAGWAQQIAAATAPGDLIGILTPVSSSFPIAMLACLAAGRPFVALDPDNPPDWLARVLGEARPALLLVANSAYGAASAARAALRTLDLNEDARPASPNWRPAPLGPDEAACVLFTSGSTGAPKGIVNSQRNLLQRVSQSINAAHINGDDRLLTLTPLATIVGVRDLITALLAGARVYLLDSRKAGTRKLLQVIHDERISILFACPALLRSVVASRPAGAGGHLRLVRVGGDTTLWSDIAALRAWLSPGTSIQLIYAATEAPIMQWFVSDLRAGAEGRIPVGYPLPGNALAVVDGNGVPVRDGEVGELLVRSPYVALGSWSGRSAADAIQADASDPAMRTFKTGDLVRRRPDGLYDRIGRKDRQVKIRGMRVELDGVEVAIRRHAAVRDVAVLARTHATDDAAGLVAYVELHDGASTDTLSDLGSMMRETVPPPMRPWRFYSTPLLPRLPNSKLDGRALRAMDLLTSAQEADGRRAPADGFSLAKDPVEILVAHIWRDTLGLALTSAGDDFFDLGGDSLLAITMTFELEEALGREVPVNLIGQAPKFAAFCARLTENGSAAYSPLVLIKPGNGAPPLFFVHGVGGSVLELFGLGRKMHWSGPVIGIQARGLDGRDPPYQTVEAMTEEYLAAVKARQPQGPYFLCGYSFGGLVAFELARRLRDGGHEVAFVGLIATLPPGHHLMRLWTWTAYLYRRLAQSLFRARAPVQTQAGQFAAGVWADLRAVAVSALSASAAYQPGTYAGELTIFEPRSRDLGLPSSAKLWSRHARALRQHSLQGRHDDMLAGANAEAAAELLTHCLEGAIRGPALRA
jgi:amino acid adenylation domain-containing protein